MFFSIKIMERILSICIFNMILSLFQSCKVYLKESYAIAELINSVWSHFTVARTGIFKHGYDNSLPKPTYRILYFGIINVIPRLSLPANQINIKIIIEIRPLLKFTYSVAVIFSHQTKKVLLETCFGGQGKVGFLEVLINTLIFMHRNANHTAI